MTALQVLVVDDNDLVVRAVEDCFRHRGDIVISAANGADALRLIEDRIFDLLLTDMVMPGMDGLELIRRAKALQPPMVCILMSGLGTRRDIISALQIGVFDFMDKPIPDIATFNMVIDRAADRSRLIRERDALLENLKQQNAKLEFSLQRLHEAFAQLRQQEDALESDLLKAQQVQRKFLPAAFPPVPGLDLFAYFGPCDQLGGDFFGIIPLSDKRLAVYLLDVAGHGVSAAIVTVTLREVMRARQRQFPENDLFAQPEAVLAFINAALIEEAFEPPVLVTMVYAVFETETGRVQLASAGHPPAVHVVAGGDTRLASTNGPVLGTKLPGTYTTADLVLAEGDCLLFYSDGFPETRDAAGVDFSVDRIRDTLAPLHGRSAFEIGQVLEQGQQKFLEGLSPADDTTFIVACRTARSRSAQDALATGSEIVADSVKIVMPEKLRAARPHTGGRIKAGWKQNRCVINFLGLITWQLGPSVREVVQQAREKSVASIAVDLVECEAMDSTILGLLLQLAKEVVLHQPGSHIVQQLHEMGVLEQFTISHKPCERPDTQLTLSPVDTREACSSLILSAHEALMAASADNRLRFKEVVDSLRHGRPDPPK